MWNGIETLMKREGERGEGRGGCRGGGGGVAGPFQSKSF